MASSDPDGVHGPIDFFLLQIPGGSDLSAGRDALLDLVANGIIRIFDLMVIRKEDDGSFSGINIEDLSDQGIGAFTAFAGARSGLLSDADLEEAAGVMDPGSTGVLLIVENTWAIPFVAAARDAKAEVIASGRIPATVVMEVLDELEAADAAS